MSRVCNYCPRTGLTDADFYSTRNICKLCTIARNNARSKARIAQKLCVDCPAPAEEGFARCASCKEAHRLRYHSRREQHYLKASARRQRLKREAFEAYGGAHCSCCGDKHLEFLTIDHAAGDGAAHRREILAALGWKSKAGSMCGSHFYRWLKQQGYPPGFRVLCMNCNFSFAKFGYCPHNDGLVQPTAKGKLVGKALPASEMTS